MTAPPSVHYAKTSDAVNIAYCTAGSGPPLVWVQPPIPSHVQLEWEQPVLRLAYEGVIAAGMTLVRFDTRGTGLSDRDVADISTPALARDLDTVVSRLGLERFAMLAAEFGAVTAMAYASAHPTQVDRLILVNPAYRGRDLIEETKRGQAFIGLAVDWELFTENVARVSFGFGYEDARRYAAFVRAAVSQEMFTRFMSNAFDLISLAPEIQAPTLVLRHMGLTWLSMESTRSLVAALPDARMVTIEGTYADNPQQMAAAVGQFLADYAPGEFQLSGTALSRAPDHATTFRTVLFTDIVGHTEMMQRLGDAKGRDVLREHERITRETLKQHGGAEVKTMGDGFMASFGSVTKAVECAIALQRAFADREGEPLSVRVGINAGEPIEEDGDLFGAAVILASRIAANADGGEILVADTVRGLCSGKGFLFADRGEFVAKGIEEPVRISEVSWRNANAS